MEVGKLGIPLVPNSMPYTLTNWDTNYSALYYQALSRTEIGIRTLARLKQDSRVNSLNGKMIVRGSSAEAFDVSRLAQWFLWRANYVGVDTAESELDDYLNSDYVKVINTLWVTGLSADKKINLLDEFCILPAAEMPETRDRISFTEFDMSFPRSLVVKPSVAIVTNSKLCKTMSDEPTEEGKKLINEFSAASLELYDIALVINSCRAVFCLPYYSTSYLPDSVPFWPFSGTGGGMGSYDVIAHDAVAAGDDLGGQVSKIYSAFRSASKDQKKRFRLILDRLSQAKRRRKLEDKILDLGIALEMLLLRDNSSKDQLSQSFRLRGAWLLGDTGEKRKELYALLKDLYAFRSEVAHGGALSKKSCVSASENYFAYQEIAEDACQKIICNGEPKWETIVLGVK